MAFPALQPPLETSFKCYVKRQKGSSDTSNQTIESPEAIIAGETDSVEFSTVDHLERPDVSASQ